MTGRNNVPKLDERIADYYSRAPEEARLSQPLSFLEALRTRELIERHAPPPPRTVLDVGGAAGAHAFWLAEKGYDVHLIEPVPRLVEEAHERNRLSLTPLASIRVGDARHLEFEGFADLFRCCEEVGLLISGMWMRDCRTRNKERTLMKTDAPSQPTTRKSKKVLYWSTTGFAAFVLLVGGVVELRHEPGMMTGLAHLGYPAYLATILGIWKLLGVAAITAPGRPRLKEWAYAGIFFNLTGAAVSHATVGDSVTDVAVPLALLVIVMTSRWLLPARRTEVARQPSPIQNNTD